MGLLRENQKQPIDAMRKIEDVNVNQVVNLPDAAGTAYTGPIDLGTGPHAERLEGEFRIGATPNLADAKKATVQLQDCATEGGAYADVAAVAPLEVTGAGGAGAAAATLAFRFPPDIKRFVRGKVTVEAAGGGNTDTELEFAILM
jgi:hypothetical protein